METRSRKTTFNTEHTRQTNENNDDNKSPVSPQRPVAHLGLTRMKGNVADDNETRSIADGNCGFA